MTTSAGHEALVRLFRNDVWLAVKLLRSVMRVRLPRFSSLRLVSGEGSERPVRWQADVVLTLRRDRRTVGAIVVEPQLGRDGDKRYAWPQYIASLRRELRAPVYLLVIAPRKSVARWAGRPIQLGHPGLALRPLVLGPEAIPVVTSVREAKASPEMAMLSVLAHADGPDVEVGTAVAKAALQAARGLDPERGAEYIAITLRAARPAVRKQLEALMRQGQLGKPTELEKRWAVRAKAEAKVEAVLAVLAARGLEVPEAVRERVQGCTDLAQLDAWLVGAAKVERAEDIFEPG